MRTAAYRIAVLADIHGNRTAFEAVLRDLDQRGRCDALLAAGDVTGGPDQEIILQRLIERDAVLIRGNGESSIVRYVKREQPDYVYTAKQYSIIRWSVENLSAASLDFFQSLPEQRVFCLTHSTQPDPIRIVHGSPRSVSELIFPSHPPGGMHLNKSAALDEVIDLVPEPVVVFGHTHLPWVVQREALLALNPGAVSFPANGYIGAQYAILRWDGMHWSADLYQVPYDMHRLRKVYEKSGFLTAGPLAHVYLRSILSGIDYLPFIFERAQRLAKQNGCDSLPYFPDEIWEQAGEAFIGSLTDW